MESAPRAQVVASQPAKTHVPKRPWSQGACLGLGSQGSELSNFRGPYFAYSGAVLWARTNTECCACVLQVAPWWQILPVASKAVQPLWRQGLKLTASSPVTLLPADSQMSCSCICFSAAFVHPERFQRWYIFFCFIYFISM